jgi:poly-beta-1,6-N-acetyl-D-glucosamine synthase
LKPTPEESRDGLVALMELSNKTAATLPRPPRSMSSSSLQPWRWSVADADMPTELVPQIPAREEGAGAKRNVIVALVPAHNEAEDIQNTIESLLAQERSLDQIVIVSDNSTDATVEIASRFPVTVMETVGNTHRKSGALNYAWHEVARNADLVVCADGDTILPPHAVREWEREFEANHVLGGSSSQPIMTGRGFLPRMQRNEFTKSATLSLKRGWCRVISGTGCCFRGEALRQACRIPGQEGPWTYVSVVEDYHLTFQLRKMGWKCEMSPSVFCYTGSMKTVKSLWYQRIKWQAGTCDDLIRFGFNRLNYREWMQQGFNILCIIFWVLWLSLTTAEFLTTGIHPTWWWLIFPTLFMLIEFWHVLKVPGRDWKDILMAVSLVTVMSYTFISMGWVIVSWAKVVRGFTGDLWAPQYRAEGMESENMQVGVSA